MEIINIVEDIKFPFEWVNLDCYKDSKSDKVEIYLKEVIYDINSDLMLLFNFLFKEIKNDILIYNESWWDFTLDTWNIETDEYDYTLNNKSDFSQQYIELLLNSNIEIGYSGTCVCKDWDIFLKIILNCITSHLAPYSPIFYMNKYNFFFYFHHTGSIGLYYKEKNLFITNLLKNAESEYIIVQCTK